MHCSRRNRCTLRHNTRSLDFSTDTLIANILAMTEDSQPVLKQYIADALQIQQVPAQTKYEGIRDSLIDLGLAPIVYTPTVIQEAHDQIQALGEIPSFSKVEGRTEFSQFRTHKKSVKVLSALIVGKLRLSRR
jgi:hypothetical protein